MSDLNDLSKPVTTDTEPNVLDTLRGHIVRAATWSWSITANKVAGLMSGVTAAVTGGRSLRLYRRNDANTADEEVISLPGISVGGNAATASAAQSGSALETALSAKAPLSSPNLTGTPTAPTAAAGTNNTLIANTAFVATAVANVVASSPAALDTLNELAAALGNDANFASTVNTALGNRVSKVSSNRPGVTKLYRNDSDDGYNVQTAWSVDRTGYWSLRGYNGDAYHAPVYVSYAGYADSAGSAPASDVYTWAKQSTKPSYSYTEIAGRPTALSSFTNDSGYQTSSGSVNYAATAGSAGSAGSATTAGTATALSTASGSAPSYSARAWVNFNGTGVVAIRSSGNVSSITDNGVGNYIVNFATAMPHANYCVNTDAPVYLVSNASSVFARISNNTATVGNASNLSTTQVGVSWCDANNFFDPAFYFVSIMG